MKKLQLKHIEDLLKNKDIDETLKADLKNKKEILSKDKIVQKK